MVGEKGRKLYLNNNKIFKKEKKKAIGKYDVQWGSHKIHTVQDISGETLAPTSLLSSQPEGVLEQKAE